MYEYVEKSKENKSRAVANSVGQKKQVQQAVGFVDKITEAITNRWTRAIQNKGYNRENKLVIQRQGKWEKIGESQYNNCTDFAFNGYQKLEFENDLNTLIDEAHKLGWIRVNNFDYASVVLYGSGSNYSHAIKKNGDAWEEVYGNDHNRWTEKNPPIFHGKDKIVEILADPIVAKNVPIENNITLQHNKTVQKKADNSSFKPLQRKEQVTTEPPVKSHGQNETSPIQCYDFTQIVIADDWKGLFFNLEQKIKEYGEIFDIDLEHIKQRHIDNSDKATHFKLSEIDVVKLLYDALKNPTIKWVKSDTIIIEYDSKIKIGINNETKIKIFISTKGMDNENAWQDAWVTTAYPIH